MISLRAWVSRFTSLFRKRRFEQDLDEDVRAHLEMLAEENRRKGLSPEEARYAALRSFGGIEQVKEECREQWGVRFLSELSQDARYGLRQLRRNPGFTIVAVLTLALGIGANTTVFSVADGILFHPLPYIKDSTRLVAIIERTSSYDWDSVIEPANFLDWQRQCRSFARMAAFQWTSTIIGGSGSANTEEAGAERVDAARVSEGFFQTLSAEPEIGRTFLPSEQQPGHDVAILSDRLWRSRFATKSGIAGQTIRLEGRSFVVVGVMPPRFDFPTGAALWMPLALSPKDWANRKSGLLHVIGFLKPSASVNEARAELGAISQRLAQTYPETNRGVTAEPAAVGELINGNLTPVFCYTLLGAVAFLLLIACTNVANLQMARAAGRWREITLRAALGAGRWRVVRQLLTETALLAAIGAGLGLAFAEAGIRLVVSSMPAETAAQVAGWQDIGLNGRALAFAIVVTLFSAFLAGVAPALRGSKIDLIGALKFAGPTTASSPLRLRSILVSAEVALALLLVVGAGLMVKGFHGILDKARTFGPEKLLTARVILPKFKYDDFARRRDYLDTALRSVRATPGVDAACLFTTPPFSNNGTRWSTYGYQAMAQSKHLPGAVVQAISGNYFRIMSIPVVAGREFNLNDTAAAPPVAIVSENLARRDWPEGGAVGRQLRLGNLNSQGPALTIVGVAADVEYDWTDNEPEPAIYIPYSQTWSSLGAKEGKDWAATYFAAKTSVEPRSLVPTLRREFNQLDPDVPSSGWETLDKLMAASLAGIEGVGGMMAGVGIISLILAVSGIYGVAAYNAEQRVREIGIRMALGAKQGDILHWALKRGSLIVIAGLAAGMAGVLALMPLLTAFFYGVRPTDTPTLLGVSLFLAAAALLATYIPARRAMRVDPMVALRYE